MDWLHQHIAQPDQQFLEQALNRQAVLTKPPGSLGMLEQIAVQVAAMQRSAKPCIEKVWVSVFAADHGIAEESVSAFPQIVTTEMVKNFANSGAAINVLSNFIKADFEVIDVGLYKALDKKGVIVERAANGTANFAKQTAMTQSQMEAALTAGKHAVARALKQQTQLFIGGEMGIANTSSATAIATVLSNLSVEQLTGAGTGLNTDGIEHKAKIIQQAIDLHQPAMVDPLKVLQCVGGFEIVALVAAYINAAQHGLTILVDGFIASVAALVAVKINPAVQAWFFYAHCSHEKGHQLVLEQLNARPLLDLNMRLGEASGAAVAVPLLQMACKLHNEMATFEQAEITIQ